MNWGHLERAGVWDGQPAACTTLCLGNPQCPEELLGVNVHPAAGCSY